jgi:hypothetical protein
MEKYLVFTLNGKEIMAYTIYGTFPGEKQATLELLAYENNCKLEDIKTHIEVR